MDPKQFLEQLRAHEGDWSDLVAENLREDGVEASFKPTYRNGVIDLQMNLIARPPALEISTWGLTLATKRETGRIEARTMGESYAESARAFVGLFASLPKGRHTAHYLALAYVKMGPGHYAGWMGEGKFEFEAP